MFRAGLIAIRRVICSASLLILLICGAEVGLRIYEAISGQPLNCQTESIACDPSKLTIPSWSVHQEMKPLASAVVECRDTNTEVQLHTNSLGLRGTEPTIPKPQNVCRVIVVGDETIYAPETPDEDHFCTLLRNQLQQTTTQHVEVINAGVPGHCPLTEFVLFKQRLISLQPDLVILHFDWSDVADDRQVRRWARCDEEGSPQACPNAKLIASKKKFQQYETWRSQFRLLDCSLSGLSTKWKQQVAKQKATSRDSDTNPYAWLREERPEQNANFRHAVSPVVDFANLCHSWHCSFVVMTSPKPWQVSSKCSRGEGVRLTAGVARDAVYTNRAPFKVLNDVLTRAGVSFVDGSVAIGTGKEAENNFLRHAPRWSSTGHRHMADCVSSYVVQNVAGPWSSPYFQRNQPISNSPNSDIQWTGGQKSNSVPVRSNPFR